MQHRGHIIAKHLASFLAISALMLGLSACQKQEGPAEQAGKELDQAVGKIGEKMESAGEALQKAAEGEKKE